MNFNITVDINLKASEEVTNSLLTLAAVLNNSVPIFDETNKITQDKISNHKSNQKTNLIDKKSNCKSDDIYNSNMNINNENDLNDNSKEISLTEIRTLLAKLSREGKQSEVKNLIKKFGGKKLTDIQKDRYIQLYKEAKTI